MLSAAGYINYNSIQNYQIWLHSSNNAVESPFYRENIRIGWYSTFMEELSSSNIKDDEITFTVNPKAHFLLYTNLIFHTPEIKSKDPNLKVAWTPNLMHNYVQSAELKFNDLLIQRFDSLGADILIQLDSKPEPGKRTQYLSDIGNLTSLTKFNDYLPSKRLSLHCPWSFSKKISKCLPLCLSTSTKIIMTFKLQRDPSKLIRVLNDTERALQYNDPVQIKGLEKNLLMYPTYYGKYIITTPKAIKWHKKIKNGEYFYDTFQEYDNPELFKNGEIASININSIYPIKALFPVLQNITSANLNNLSNYTSNPFDSYLGPSPISKYNLSYGMVSILDQVDSEIFSNDETYWNCSSCPERPGYSAIVFPSSLEKDEDVGIVLSSVGGSLSVAIKDNTNSEYKFKVRALVTNVFKYENNMLTISKDSNQSNLQNNWTSWNI